MLPENSARRSLLEPSFRYLWPGRQAGRQAGREGGRKMSAPRPYVTHPSRPLSSINSWSQFIRIQQHSIYFLHVVRSSVSCGGACALEETLVFMVQSHYKSYVFPCGTLWCIQAQNTRHPRIRIRCGHKIVRYLGFLFRRLL